MEPEIPAHCRSRSERIVATPLKMSHSSKADTSTGIKRHGEDNEKGNRPNPRGTGGDESWARALLLHRRRIDKTAPIATAWPASEVLNTYYCLANKPRSCQANRRIRRDTRQTDKASKRRCRTSAVSTHPHEGNRASQQEHIIEKGGPGLPAGPFDATAP